MAQNNQSDPLWMRYEYPVGYRVVLIDQASVSSSATVRGPTLNINLIRVSNRLLSESYRVTPSGQLEFGGPDVAFTNEIIKTVEITALVEPTTAVSIASAILQQLTNLDKAGVDMQLGSELKEAINDFNDKLIKLASK